MIPRDLAPILKKLFESDRTEIEKVSSTFYLIANYAIEHSKNDCELFRATGDRESLIKEQIKHSTISHMLNVYSECYLQATGTHLELENYDE